MENPSSLPLIELLWQEPSAFAAYEALTREPWHLKNLQRFYWYRDHHTILSKVFEEIVYHQIPEEQGRALAYSKGDRIPSQALWRENKDGELIVQQYEALLNVTEQPERDYFLYYGSLYFMGVLHSPASEPCFWYQENVYLIPARAEEHFEQPLLKRAVDCFVEYRQQMIKRIKEVKKWK